MYSERLNKLINQVCHAWEEQAAEHEGKMRALANSIVSEHEAERFNTQKAFKSALAAKNNEINALLSECKKLKALLTHIHGENKELQKKLSMANRTIESLRQGGISYDENGIPTSKQLYLGSNDDSSVFNSDDTLSVGGLGGDYYGNSSGNIGGLDELSISHNQLPPWNQSSSSSSSSSRQQSLQQQQQQQSHLFPRGRNSPDVDMYGYNQGGVGGGIGSGGGYYPENDPSIRGPPSLTQPHSSSSSSGIGGLFSSSSTTSSSVPSLPSSSSQHFPTRPGPSHGLVYGGRFVLESAGEDPPGLYPRDEYQVDRSSSYDLTRPDRENDEYNQHPQYLDESSSSLSSSSQIPGQTHAQAQAAAAAAASSKRLSPSAPSFMPGSTGMKNNGSQQQSISVGNSPVTRSNSSGSATLTTPALSSVSLSSSSILNPNVDFNQNPPPPPGFESFPTSRDPFYEDGQQIISNSNVDPNSNSSLSKIGLEVDPSSSIILNDKDSMDGQLTTSSPLSLQTNEAGTVSVINQMRLQSKSSKLDAKPLISSPTSPISSPPSSHPNINSNNFNTTSTSSFPSSNLYSEGL